MKRTVKLSAAIIVLAMCMLLSITAWAANEDSATDAYTAAFEDSTLCVSDKDQTVVLTVKAAEKITMDSLTAQVVVPDGWTITAIANEDLNFDANKHLNLANGVILWYTDGSSYTTDLLATVTITVPANTAAGDYTVNFVINEIGANYGTPVVNDVTVSATLNISACADGDDEDHDCDNCGKEDVDNGHHGGSATCMAGAVCEECGETYTDPDTTNHSYTTYTYTVRNGYETAECDYGCESTDTRLKDGYVDGGQCGENLYWELTTDGVMTISGTGAMYDWTYSGERAPWGDKVKELIVEAGATTIGDFAFYGCFALQKITLPTTLTTICAYAFSGTNVKDVVIPEGVTTIETYAFDYCENITSLTLPSTLTTIGDYAFQQCYLGTELVIPANVTSIGIWAFHNCDSLDTITFLGNAPAIGANAFAYVEATCYYPVKDATWTDDVMEDYGEYTLTWLINCDHSNVVVDAAVAAGCETTGLTEGSHCGDCDTVLVAQEVTSAIGHSWVANGYTITDDTHTKNYVCANDATHTKSDAAEKHNYVDGKCEACGAEEPVTNISVIDKTNGTATYTVNGNVVTVTCNIACKVGYWDATNEKYVAITAVAADGSYTFTAPDGVTEVLLVVKGDVTGDGKISNTDVTQLNAANLNKRTLTDIAVFAGDVTGDGKISNTDVTQLNATNLSKRVLTW